MRPGAEVNTSLNMISIDRVGFSCLLLKRRGLATGSHFGGDWLLHRVPWSSCLQTAHYIQICRHSIRPPPLHFNNKQLKPTRSINWLITRFESPVNQCERALRHPESTVDADVQVLVLGLVLRAVLLRRPTGSGLKWYDRINLNVVEFTHASSQTLEPIELTW